MPVLPDLVTTQDFTDYGYDPAAAVKAAAASARVRRFLRPQHITAETSTITLTKDGPWLLPQRPVRAVTSVTIDGAEVAYELDGSWLSSEYCAPLTVVYDHGFTVLPDDLVELMCAICVRLAAIPTAMAAGARSEQAGGESITWGADGWAGTTGLTRPEMEALRKIYPVYPRTTIMRATP